MLLLFNPQKSHRRSRLNFVAVFEGQRYELILKHTRKEAGNFIKGDEMPAKYLQK